MGEIPSELGGLESLEELALHDNQLTGEIPSELGELESLEGLALADNQLTGEIPSELGGLESLTRLYLSGNDGLSGPLPLELKGLPLAWFWYHDTDLCVPADESFRAWLNAIADHQGTGADCPLSDRDILVALYDATGGSNWTNNTNWLSDEPIGTWHGVTTNSDGRVTSLTLYGNGLSGSIPPELGGLESLTTLSLYGNGLSGSIPPELGGLESLMHLHLSGNRLSGPIPPELGDLESLTYLYLGGNGLSGSIPPELGGLESLMHLHLSGNRLSGPIPPELGDLESLTVLQLDVNDLSGSIPPELGGLESLTQLTLYENDGLSGPLPLELKGLPLELFRYDNTDLCVPLDESFRAWLNAIADHQGTGADC